MITDTSKRNTMPIKITTINSQDIDDVETNRQQRKDRVDKSNLKLVCLTGNHSSKTVQEPVQPHINSFENVKKPRTRAERHFVEEEEKPTIQAAKISPKRERRSDYWVVQDTQRMNRTRRLKQLDTEFPLNEE